MNLQKFILCALLLLVGGLVAQAQATAKYLAHKRKAFQPAAAAGGYQKLFDTGVSGTAGGCVTAGLDSSGSTLIVVGVSFYSTQPTLSDSKGNTWSALTAKIETTASSRLYYCVNPTVGSSHTFTLTGGDGTEYTTLAVLGFSGNAGSPFDAESGTASATPVTTIQPGSITPAGGGELFVALLTFNNTTRTASIGSSFISLAKLAAGATVPGGSYLAYKIKVDATAENPTWTITDTVVVTAVMAAFK